MAKLSPAFIKQYKRNWRERERILGIWIQDWYKMAELVGEEHAWRTADALERA